MICAVEGKGGRSILFPRLMQLVEDESVLYVTGIDGEYAKGFVVALGGRSNEKVGVYSEEWWAESLVDFVGTVSLSNI